MGDLDGFANGQNAPGAGFNRITHVMASLKVEYFGLFDGCGFLDCQPRWFD